MSPSALPTPAYYVLGIASGTPVLPSIYCRYVPPPADATEDEKAQYPEGDCMTTFHGPLPNPAESGLEAVAFDTPEAAQAHCAAEIKAGSTWHYALWIA